MYISWREVRTDTLNLLKKKKKSWLWYVCAGVNYTPLAHLEFMIEKQKEKLLKFVASHVSKKNVYKQWMKKKMTEQDSI